MKAENLPSSQNPTLTQGNSHPSFDTENFIMAVAGGLVSTITAAILIASAALIAETFHIGFTFLIPVFTGLVIRLSGNGSSLKYGLLGSGFSLLGALICIILAMAGLKAVFNGESVVRGIRNTSISDIATYWIDGNPLIKVLVLAAVLMVGYLLAKKNQ